jgi:uncharacterized protein YkwD
MKYCIISFLILISCQSVENIYKSSAKSVQTFTKNISDKQYEKEKDAENWNLTLLDTAVNSEYLTNTEKNVILELNKVRTDPQKYSKLYIVPMLKQYSNNKELFINGQTYITSEGKNAALECINVLEKARKVDVLQPDEELYKMALDHVEMQGPTGFTGHESPNGDSFKIRIKKNIINSKIIGIGENIDYGNSSARDIILSLLIDDGVPSRGHRKNILTPNFNIVGVSIGNHTKYKKMCVTVFGNIKQ